MKIDLVSTLRGYRPLVQDEYQLLSVKKRELYLLSFKDLKKQQIGHLPISVLRSLIGRFRLIKRLLRLTTYCSIKIDYNHYLISEGRTIYRLNILNGISTLEKRNHQGTKPLSFCNISGIKGFSEMTCYGEYVKNSEQRSINILGRDAAGNWNSLYMFASGEIGHIHSLAPDPYRNCVWIFTGDYGDAAAIWCATDNFKHVKCVLRGRQEYRASMGYPVEEGIIYATDSHLERNSIRLLKISKNSAVSEKLYDLNGSCIYSMQLGNKYFFSTSVEPNQPTGRLFFDLVDIKPGPGILSNYCEVVAGNIHEGFSPILKWKADKLPKRLFQFSSIIFPMCTTSNGYLSLYGQGCTGHDDQTELYRIQ